MTYNIESSEQDLVDIFEKEVNQLLNALGCTEAFVTDESCISDFIVQLPSKIFRYTCDTQLLHKLLMDGNKKEIDKYKAPIKYTEEEELDALKIQNQSIQKVKDLFNDIDIEITSRSKIGELAQLLSFISKRRTIH